ncbi:MAG: hypothetical protein JO284_20285, partial [Planctomycetaceae bacterium]|nr:hypothetical protein [Planctomycetaceae bacterium]
MKKEMLINVLQPEECRIAIVEDGVLEELYVERTSHESYTGNIYKGRIVNLEPAIQAAFVDFSVGRNGFLHVSDVEPQYYDRHQDDEAEPIAREPRRERDDRRRGRTSDEREPNSSPPPRIEERDRDRARDRERPERPERPERSERGRRDRSEPRRFGEGLVDDWSPPPLPRPAEPAPRPEPEPPLEQDESRRARAELPSLSWGEEAALGRAAEYEPRPAEPEEPRGRIGRPAESFDPDLPPSRTQRSRLPSLPPRPMDFDFEEPGRFRTVPEPLEVEPEPEPELPPAREPRRHPRGQGRPGRPTPEPEAPFEAEAEPEFPDIEPEPSSEEPPETTRRRGGRAAIRSRGGEREREAEAERPREPIAERPRSFVAERPTELEPERTRERERASELERARTPELELPRAKPHARAGEPGYVPRRERSRAPESPFDIDSPSLPASPWSDLAAEPEFEPEVEVEPGAEEGVAEPGKLEGPRRRRRRRGRRRERDRERPEREVAPAPADEDLAPALEEEEGEEAEPVLDHEAPRRGDAEVEGVTLLDEFDFGEEPLVEEYEEAGQDELREEPARAAVEEAIDPELE